MYPIRKLKSYRPKTEYIILCQSINLINTKRYIDPSLLRTNYKFTWGMWQEYFIHDLMLFDVPCHYFVELLDRDYVIYKGLADQKKSSYIDELVANEVLHHDFRNSILIVLQDNLSIDIPDRRMYDQLCNKLLSQLYRTYHLNFSRVRMLDECLTPDWKEKLQQSPLNYEIKEAKYYDRNIFELSYNKYYKF